MASEAENVERGKITQEDRERIRPTTTWEEYSAAQKEKNKKAEMFVTYVLQNTDFANEKLAPLKEKTPGEILDMEDKGGEVFLRAAQLAIKELVTHGVLVKNEEGEYLLKPFSDLDGKCCLGLMEMAGLTSGAKITYVEPGKEVKGAVMMDTGGRNVEYEEGSMYIDHHADDSKSGTSATEETYDILFRCGLIQPTMALEGMADFVTGMDNGSYPGMHKKENFLNSWKTMIGMSRFLGFQEMKEYFSDLRNDPLRPLGFNRMDKWPIGTNKKLNDRSNEMKIDINRSVDAVERLRDEHMYVETKKYGKVLVDIGKQVPLGRDAAFALGFDTYLGWNPDNNGFVINSTRKITDELAQGFGVREYMWLKPRNVGGDLTLRLDEVLDTLAGGTAWTEGKLAEYLNKGIKSDKEAEEEGLAGFFDPDREEKEVTEELAGIFDPDLQEENEEVIPEEIEEQPLVEILAEQATPEVVSVPEIETVEAIEPEPSLEREEELDEGITAESETRLINEAEKLNLEKLEQEAIRRKQWDLVQQLRSEYAAKEEERNNRFSLVNLFNGKLWKRAVNSTKSWWRRVFG
ncbi:MAG TPA: hypothetical protein VF837_02505 [Patescibacteria group bacterium]